jgi:hypothetical protein
MEKPRQPFSAAVDRREVWRAQKCRPAADPVTRRHPVVSPDDIGQP